MPSEYKNKYVDILYKHQKAISANKYDLGLATHYKHKIHLKDNSPVYRKQFKIPESHQQFIEQSLDEWLKLGVIKHANSLYNSPIFCVPKKRPGPPCGPRLSWIKQSFTHWQIFHERNHRVHWGHWTCKFDHFYYPWFNIWFLANATRWKVSTPHGFHNSGQRSIQLDNVTNETFGLPCQFSKAYGRRHEKHF